MPAPALLPLLPILTLLASAPAVAQQPEQVVDGIHAGMPAPQAKAAGYTNCTQADSDTVYCSRQTPAKEALGLQVKSIAAIFERPYAAVKEVRITFATGRKPMPECRPTKGQWGDVISAECAIDIPAAITRAWGPPVTRSTWHKCGRYVASFEAHVGQLHLYDKPDDLDYQKMQCAQAARERREEAAAKKSAGDFVKSMK